MAFGSLTGFFGTNSSGKSSILQFLLMLKQTVESSDRSRVLHLGDDKSFVDLGTMDDILHNHIVPSELSFSFEWKDLDMYSLSNNNLSDLFSLFPTTPYQFSAAISAANNEIVLSQFSYQKNNYIYNFISQKSISQRAYKLILYNIDASQKEEVEGTFKNPNNFYGVPNDLYLTHPAIRAYAEYFGNFTR